MTPQDRRRGVLPFLFGAATALVGARLFVARPRPGGLPDLFGEQTGRGETGAPPSATAATAGYEVDDASARGIGKAIAIFAFSAMTGIGLMVLLLHVLHQRDAGRVQGLTAMQRTQSEPPLPHLQADPIGELGAQRAREAGLLLGYARLNATTARIPIGRAMALVTGQSLDAHATAARTP